MNCENIQFNLSAYLDDCLSVQERAAVDAHLPACPLCRDCLADFQSLRNSLRALPRAEMPNDLLASLRTRVAEEIKITRREPNVIFTEAVREWLKMRLFPYAAATAITLVFGLSLLWTLLSAANDNRRTAEIARAEPFAKSTVLLAGNSSADFTPARLSIAKDSPSVNPDGALIALTKSLVRGNMKNEEVVVVADVFGNGLAQISEVIEPSGDRRAVRELKEALENNPDFAPFLPSSVDGRSDTVRVVLRIQRVDVQTRVKPRNRK